MSRTSLCLSGISICKISKNESDSVTQLYKNSLEDTKGGLERWMKNSSEIVGIIDPKFATDLPNLNVFQLKNWAQGIEKLRRKELNGIIVGELCKDIGIVGVIELERHDEDTRYGEIILLEPQTHETITIESKNTVNITQERTKNCADIFITLLNSNAEYFGISLQDRSDSWKCYFKPTTCFRHMIEANMNHFLPFGDFNEPKYWKELFDEIEEERNELIGLYSGEGGDKVSSSGMLTVDIEKEVLNELEKVSLQNQLPLNAVLQFAWHSVLHTFGNGSGAPTIVGTLVCGNILPTILRWKDKEVNVVRGIQNIQQQLGRLNHVNVAVLPVKHPQIDSIFICGDDEKDAVLPECPLAILVKVTNVVNIKVKYDQELFSEESIQRLLSTLSTILQGISRGRLQGLELLNELERAHILNKFNSIESGDHGYPLERSIQEQFEEQFKRNPKAVAFVYNNANCVLTYEQLNEKVNQLAHHLNNITQGDISALFFERSEWQIIAMFAIWRVGGAFVPIDPAFPSSRINFILNETKPKVILTTEQFSKILNTSIPVLQVDHILKHEEKFENPATSRAQGGPRDLAYIMFTSGTTGDPKGVLVEHVALVNISYALASRYQLNPPEVILQMHNYVFDAYLEQVCLSLLQGHALLLAPPTLGDIKGLARIIEKGKVTHLDTTPSLIGELDLKNCEKLKRVVIGGEAFTSSAFAFLSSLPQRPLVFNVYGPTEVGVTAAVHFMDSFTRKIGKPIPNVCAYVLDSQGQPLPIGAIGEIYLGSVGLARGYLNRPELTNTKFIRNPFKSDGTLFYKTGDIGKWSVDGVLEYIGRNDLQVKIRGQRVELSEIENILSSFPGVESSAVEFKKYQNSSLLIGYYVASSPLNEDAMLEFMMKKLPDYMVPTHYVKLTHLPLTLNGKLDKKNLPSPIFKFTPSSELIQPRNKMEEALCSLFASALGMQEHQVGANSDFFRLGGDSLISIQIVSKLREEFGFELTIRDIFMFRTIENIAKYVKVFDVVEGYPTRSTWQSENVFIANSLQMGFIAHALRSNDAGDGIYVLQEIIKYHSLIQPLILEKAWKLAVEKWGSFRLRFNWNDQLIQIVERELEHNWWRYSEDGADIEAILEKDKLEGYDLSKGELFRVYLIRHRVDEFTCIFSSHHSIIDGWSVPILFSFIHSTYSTLEAMLPLTATIVDTSYERAQSYLQNQDHEMVMKYWDEILQHINEERNELIGLYSEEERGVPLAEVTQITNPLTATLKIEGDIYDGLVKLSHEHGLSLNSILQFAWHSILHIYGIGGGVPTVVGTTVWGRNLPIDGIHSSVGLYINTLPLICYWDWDTWTNVLDPIKHIQNQLIELNTKSQGINLGKLHIRGHRLFDSVFAYNVYPKTTSDDKLNRDIEKQLGVEWCGVIEKIDYPLSVIVLPLPEGDTGLEWKLAYAGEIFKEATIKRILSTLSAVLGGLSRGRFDKIEWLTSTEHKLVVEKFNENGLDTHYNPL